MTTLTDLKALLDEAQGPSREIDRSFHLLRDDIEGLAFVFAVPEYTSSIDAALALIEHKLPGRYCHLGTGPSFSHAVITVGEDNPETAWFAPTLALAILRALVAALIEQENGE